MEWSRVASMSGWVQRVVLMVWGERTIGAGVLGRRGGNGMGDPFGDLFDALYEPLDDI
jgi:hypothetical protein